MRTDWTPIPGYEGIYEITSDGFVKSLDRMDSIGRMRKGDLLSFRRTKGYPTVSLSKDGIQKGYKVHYLVLLTFKGPRPNGYVCRHLNGDPSDNRVENLAYGTPKDNMDDMRRHGNQNYLSGEDCWKAKFTNEQVKKIREDFHQGLISQKEIRETYGLAESTTAYLLQGKSWKNAGGPLKPIQKRCG